MERASGLKSMSRFLNNGPENLLGMTAMICSEGNSQAHWKHQPSTGEWYDQSYDSPDFKPSC
jgi:hypothetical protein